MGGEQTHRRTHRGTRAAGLCLHPTSRCAPGLQAAPHPSGREAARGAHTQALLVPVGRLRGRGHCPGRWDIPAAPLGWGVQARHTQGNRKSRPLTCQPARAWPGRERASVAWHSRTRACGHTAAQSQTSRPCSVTQAGGGDQGHGATDRPPRPRGPPWAPATSSLHSHWTHSLTFLKRGWGWGSFLPLNPQPEPSRRGTAGRHRATWTPLPSARLRSRRRDGGLRVRGGGNKGTSCSRTGRRRGDGRTGGSRRARHV